MKIIQLSDLHLVCPNGKIGSIKPQKRLKRAVEHINRHHQDAHCCIVTGDIADAGDVKAYELGRKILDNLSIPYHIMIGNHDLRQPLLETFQNTPACDGFVQYKFEFDNHVFICLDTVKEHVPYGELCPQRVKWLESTLTALRPQKPIYLFMHHPPFDINIPWLDVMKLKDIDAFYETIKPFPIKFLFFGHVHRPCSGSWRNIPYASCRSIGTYQVSAYNKPGFRFPMTSEAPMYSAITIADEQIHIDMQDFLNDKIKFQD